MSYGDWKIIKSNIQGDISYELRKILTTPVYVEFELTAFGQKWTKFDLAFEYRQKENSDWKEDAVIIETTSDYLRNNKMHGITASRYGTSHIIKWKYSENNILYDDNIQIRLRFLPRLRIFSSSIDQHPISSLYGDGLIDFDGISRHHCIGINNDGQYMCVGKNVFYIIDSLDAEEESTSSGS